MSEVIGDLAIRYREDANFHQLVKVLMNMIATGQFSLGEIKQAANYAGTLYEMHHAAPTHMIPTPTTRERR